MRRLFLLLVLAFAIFASSGVLSASPPDANLPVGEGNRLLRMNELSTKLKAASQYFKKGISSAKLSWAEKKRAFDVRGLIKKGTSETELLNKQVTSDEYFKAMRLDPRFKERSGAWTKDALAKNPKLREKFGKWIAYDDFVKRKLPGVTA